MFTVALYWVGLDGPYILDDYPNLGSSRITDLSWAGLQDWWHSAGGMPSRRPLSFLTFAANFRIFGEESFHFKAVNLAIHVCIGLLLYVLAERVLRLLLPEQSITGCRLSAATVAAVWLVHPMHVSTVLYIVQRMAQLSTLFTVVSVLAYLALRQALLDHRPRAATGYLLGLIAATIAALASKQNGVLIPVFIIIFEIALLSTPFSALRARRTILLALFAGVLPIAAGLISAAIMHDDLMVHYARRTFTLDERMATEFRILWEYMRQLLLPRLSNFGLYRNDVEVSDFGDAITWLSLTAWIATLFLAFLTRRRAPLLFFGILWFLGAHSLESTIIPLELRFEHRNYLASFGVVLILVQLIILGSRMNLRASIPFLVAALLGTLSFQTFSRATTWADFVRLSHTAVEEHPDSPRARAIYGATLADLGKFDQAIEQFEIGQTLSPDEAAFSLHALLVSCQSGRHAKQYYDTARNILSTHRITVYDTSILVRLHKAASTSNCPDFGLTHMRDLLDAAVTNPSGRTIPRNQAVLLRHRGILHAWQLRNPDAGIEDLKRSIDIYPNWQRTRLNLVQTLIRYRRYDDALAWLDRFEKKGDPISPSTRNHLQSLRFMIMEFKIAAPPDDGYRPPSLENLSPWAQPASRATPPPG